VGGQVQSAKLVNQVRPVYPPLARQARIQGTVRLEAVINKDGVIEELKVISGHPLLIPAAQAAVAQWRYEPTLLNGVPVEVITTIDVNFTLGG
jgi:protein TonB